MFYNYVYIYVIIYSEASKPRIRQLEKLKHAELNLDKL